MSFSLMDREYGGGGEFALLLSEVYVEHHLHQDVAKLLRHALRLPVVDGLQQFVALLQEVLLQGVVGLLPVPGTAAGAQQPVDHPLQGLVGI